MGSAGGALRRLRAALQGAGDEGEANAGIEVEAVDLAALGPAAQSGALEAMRRLCAGLETPLRLLVLRRPLEPEPPGALPPGRVAARLEVAMRDHHESVLRAAPAFRNRVLALCSTAAGDAAVGKVQLALVADCLTACGLVWRPLSAVELAALEAEPPALRETPGAAVGDGGCWVTLEADRLPGRPVCLGWVGGLLRLDACLDLTVTMLPVGEAAAHRVIDRRLRALSANRLLDLERGRLGAAGVEAGLEAGTALRQRLARNQARPLRLAVAVALCGPDAATARHLAELARATAAAAGLHLVAADLRQLPALRAMRPGAPPAAGALVESTAAATCLPLTETVCADPGGYRLGRSRASRVPVRVDPFDTTHHGNANIAVFAASGHGKSFSLATLILEAVAHGSGALVVDPEGEYERVIRAVAGEYLQLGGRGGALNVFDAGATLDESVLVAVDLVDVLCGDVLTEVERAAVDAALRAIAHRALSGDDVPLLGACVPLLETTAPRAAMVLRRVCAGPLGAIFNRPSDMAVGAEVCAVSLRELPEEFIPAATLLIASWLWTRVRRDPRRRHVVLDEVGALCVHPPLRSLLVQLARRCRKYGASLVVATQNSSDLLATEAGAVVATNCSTVLLGGHRAAEARRMEEAFGLTGDQRRFLERAVRGEFLLLAGPRRLEIRVEVPALHHSLIQAATGVEPS